eukprot:scaffold470467_cov55-Attheya_sp.AAC.1
MDSAMKRNTNVELDLKCPDDLTPECMTELWRQAYHGAGDNSNVSTRPTTIHRVSITPMNEGVLSRVVTVELGTATSQHATSGDTRGVVHNVPAFTLWVAKFQRPSLPQPDMFAVESAFYTRAQFHLDLSAIRTPVAIHCAPHCIILEKIQATKNDTNTTTKARIRIEQLVVTMATVHASNWGFQNNHNDTESTRKNDLGLSPRAGIGAALSGLDKERTFGNFWSRLVDNTLEEEEISGAIIDKNRVQTFCQALENQRLRDLHNRVYDQSRKRGIQTFIHGDLHAGNFIWDDDDDDDDDEDTRPWLVDWATCGPGNPIAELSFFLTVTSILSKEKDEATTMSDEPSLQDMPRVNELIDIYYDTLTSTKSALHSERIQKSLPRNVLDEMLADCLVNQFVILVCYDQVSRQLVQTVLKEDGLDPSKLLRHFDRVNRISLQYMSSPLVQDHFQYPPAKSPAEIKEQATWWQQQGTDGTTTGSFQI